MFHSKMVLFGRISGASSELKFQIVNHVRYRSTKIRQITYIFFWGAGGILVIVRHRVANCN